MCVCNLGSFANEGEPQSSLELFVCVFVKLGSLLILIIKFTLNECVFGAIQNVFNTAHKVYFELGSTGKIPVNAFLIMNYIQVTMFLD